MGLLGQLLVYGVVLGALYALLALSTSLIYATTGTFHFAHGTTYVLGAYTAVLLAGELDLPWPLAVLAGVAVGGVLGAVWEVVFYRPMRQAGATNMSIFIVSLGISVAVPPLIQIVFGAQNRSLPLPSSRTLALGPVVLSTYDIATFVVSAACVVLVLVLRRTTRYGLAATAVQNNPVMAAAVGILPRRIYVLVFVVGSALMAVAALLFLLSGTASPYMGLTPTLYGFIGMFLGGVGSHSRAALGGFALGIISSVSGVWLSQDFSAVLVFALLFVALIIRPHGLFAPLHRRTRVAGAT